MGTSPPGMRTDMRKKSTKTQPREKALAAETARLAKRRDADIDYSDIPETDAAFWAKAELTPPAGKSMISIRLDTDVLDWYRRHARRYQTLMNAVLRSYKEAKEREDRGQP